MKACRLFQPETHCHAIPVFVSFSVRNTGWLPYQILSPILPVCFRLAVFRIVYCTLVSSGVIATQSAPGSVLLESHSYHWLFLFAFLLSLDSLLPGGVHSSLPLFHQHPNSNHLFFIRCFSLAPLFQLQSATPVYHSPGLVHQVIFRHLEHVLVIPQIHHPPTNSSTSVYFSVQIALRLAGSSNLRIAE